MTTTRWPIIAMIGPSGSGKTTLIDALLARCPGRIEMIRSITTRPRRPPGDPQGKNDDRDYDFIDDAAFDRVRDDGFLVQEVVYAGNRYGNDARRVDETLARVAGALALTEQGVLNFRAKGYRVVTIKVVPLGAPDRRSPERRASDAAREQLLPASEIDHVLVNRHDGGLRAAKNVLYGIVERYLPPPSS